MVWRSDGSSRESEPAKSLDYAKVVRAGLIGETAIAAIRGDPSTNMHARPVPIPGVLLLVANCDKSTSRILMLDR
jgi:hypothetical protein